MPAAAGTLFPIYGILCLLALVVALAGSGKMRIVGCICLVISLYAALTDYNDRNWWRERARRAKILSESIESSKNLITIKYVLNPFRTFVIEGTDLKNINLAGLTHELSQYKATHRDDQFELYAEVKCTPEESNKIIKAIQKAGIDLKHYWAPISIIDPNTKPGPYGSGHVDILNNRKR